MNSNEVNTDEQPADNQEVPVTEDENSVKKKKSKKEKQKNKKNKKNEKKKQDDKDAPEETSNKKKKKQKEKKNTNKKSVVSADKINPEQSKIEKVDLSDDTDETLPSSSFKNTNENYINDQLARIKADLENLQNNQEKKMHNIEDIRKQKESILAQQKKLKMEYEEWKLKQAQQHKEFKRKTKDEIKEKQLQLKSEHERWKQKQKEKRRDTKRRLKEEYRERKKHIRSADSLNSKSDSHSSSESVSKTSRKSRTHRRNQSTILTSRGQLKNFINGVANSMYRTLGIRKAWCYIKKRVTRKVIRRAYRICVKKTRKAIHFITYIVTNYYNIIILVVLVVFSTYLIFIRKGAAPLEPE